MTKVLVATEKPFAAVAVDGIRKVVEDAGFELALLEKYTSRDELLKAVADADALIIRSDKVGEDVFTAAPSLKIVVRAGAGYDNVDLAAATAHGVVVENTPGQNSNAVAELALGMMVMAARNSYDGTSGSELMGKSLGIQAFGQVGRNVARIAKGFGMKVSAVDPYCPAEVIRQSFREMCVWRKRPAMGFPLICMIQNLQARRAIGCWQKKCFIKEKKNGSKKRRTWERTGQPDTG